MIEKRAEELLKEAARTAAVGIFGHPNATGKDADACYLMLCEAMQEDEAVMTAVSTAIADRMKLEVEIASCKSFDWERRERLDERLLTLMANFQTYLRAVVRQQVTIPNKATRDKLRRAVGMSR